MESLVLELPYASLGRRVLAFLLDSLFLCVPVAFAGHVMPVLGGLILWFFYAPVLESSELRATLGKYLAGIQVADLAGRRLSLKAALIRNVLKVISSVLLFIGFFFALFTRRKQALHDLLADTLVVYGRSECPIAEAWSANVREIFNSPARSVYESERERVRDQEHAESILEKLERLQALREKGSLTEDEFQVAKKKLLSE